MRQITQDKFYKEPSEDCRGNCQQAAVASILGMELNDVPNFHDSPEGFWCGFHNFVKSRGLRVVNISPSIEPDVFYLAYGLSPRGVRHACVYRRGTLIWDPHPSRAGLSTIDEINLLVPEDPGASVTKDP